MTLLEYVVLSVLFPDLGAFDGNSKLINVYAANVVTVCTAHVGLRQRRLMTDQGVNHDLNRLLVRLLAARMFIHVTVKVDRENRIRRIVEDRDIIVNERYTTDSTDLSTFNVITHVFDRLMYDFNLNLIVHLSRHRQEAAILKVNFESVQDQRLDGAPLPLAIEDAKGRIMQRPDANRRQDSETIVRALIPVVAPTYNLNVSGVVVGRLLPRVGGDLSLKVVTRISNSKLSVKADKRQHHTHRPYRKVRRTDVAEVKHGMKPYYTGLLNDVMRLVPHPRPDQVSPNLVGRVLIVRPYRQSKVRQRYVRATVGFREDPHTQHVRVQRLIHAGLARIFGLSAGLVFKGYVVLGLRRV